MLNTIVFNIALYELKFKLLALSIIDESTKTKFIIFHRRGKKITGDLSVKIGNQLIERVLY